MQTDSGSACIYFTGANDTPESIAFKLTGDNNSDLAKQIWQINKNSLAQRVMHHRAFASERAILIPHPKHPFSPEQERTIYELDWMMSSERHTICTMIKNHISPHTIIRTFDANQHINQQMSQNGFFAWLGTALYEMSDGIIGYKVHQIERFNEAVSEMRDTLAKYLAKGPVGLRNEERKAFQEAYRRLLLLYQDDINHYKLSKEAAYTDIIKAYRFARHSGVEAMNTHEAKRLALLAKALKWVGGCLAVFNVVKDYVEIKKSYHQHGHWIKMAAEDALEIGAGVGIGFGMGILFTSGGWIAVLGLGTLEGGLNIAIDKLINVVGDVIDP